MNMRALRGEGGHLPRGKLKARGRAKGCEQRKRRKRRIKKEKDREMDLLSNNKDITCSKQLRGAESKFTNAIRKKTND